MFALFVFLFAQSAWAISLADQVIADTDPTALAPAPWTVQDFGLVWEPSAPAGLEARLVPGSLQWVRVEELLVLPRALVAVHAPSAGILSVGNKETALSPDPGGGFRAEILVPLLSGKPGEIQVSLGSQTYRLRSRFESHERTEPVLLDPSCSRAPVRVNGAGLRAGSWAVAGCRTFHTRTSKGDRGELEVLVYVDGNEEPSPRALRLSPSSQTFDLSGPAGKLEFRSSLPEVTHRARVGLGLGPYRFQHNQGNVHTSLLLPLATLYVGYSLSSTNRLVLFGAVTGNSHFYSDSGAYFQFESFRTFDRRVSFQLLIGGHALTYRAPGVSITRFNLPQGFEIFGQDILGRGKNASLGGFLQPSINGKEYVNTWLRWGPSSYFLELNFIYAGEPEFVIRTYGLSVGMPLFEFL